MKESLNLDFEKNLPNELMSSKIMYSIGIFYENAVNRILKDFVKAVKPRWTLVRGEFNPRGGITSIVEARFSKDSK